MRKRWPRSGRGVLAAVILCALVASACGGGEGTLTLGPETAESVEATPTPAATVAPIATVAPVETVAPTATSEPIPTPTAVPVATPTVTPEATPTPTPPVEATPTPTRVAELTGEPIDPDQLVDAGSFLRGLSNAIGTDDVVAHVRPFAPNYPDVFAFPDDAVLIGLTLTERVAGSGDRGLFGTRIEIGSAQPADELEALYLTSLENQGFELDGAVQTAERSESGIDTLVAFQPLTIADVSVTYVSVRIQQSEGRSEVTLYVEWDEAIFAGGLREMSGAFPVPEGFELDKVDATIFRFDDTHPVYFEWVLRADGGFDSAAAVTAATLDQLPSGEWEYLEAPNASTVEAGLDTVTTRIRNTGFPDAFDLSVAVGAGRASMTITGQTTASVRDYELPVDPATIVEDRFPSIAITGALAGVGQPRPALSTAAMATPEGIRSAMYEAVGASNVTDHVSAFDPLFDRELPLPPDAVLLELAVKQNRPGARGDDVPSVTDTTAMIATSATVEDLEAWYAEVASILGYEPLGGFADAQSDAGVPVRRLALATKDRGDGLNTRLRIELSSADGWNVVSVWSYSEHPDPFPGPSSGWLFLAPRPEGWELARSSVVLGVSEAEFGLVGRLSASFAGPIDTTSESLSEAQNDMTAQLPRGAFSAEASASVDGAEGDAALSGDLDHDVFGNVSYIVGYNEAVDVPGYLSFTAHIEL